MGSNSFQPPYNTSFGGIITFLNTKYPNSWINYITITPSSTNQIDSRNGAMGLINRSITTNTYSDNWCSSIETQPYFIITFPRFFVNPSFYSLQSKTMDNIFSKSWFVEGSNNNKTWYLLDIKQNRSELLDQGASFTYVFDNTETFRFFKFTQTEANTESRMCLRSFEIFGTIRYSLQTYLIAIHIPARIAFVLFLL